MKYIEATVYASQAGVEPLIVLLSEYGINELIINDPMDFVELMDKKNSYDWDYIDENLQNEHESRDIDEVTVTFYIEDNQAGQELLQRIKLSVMMLKSKEMEGEFGWDTSLGRLYLEDKRADDAEWTDQWKAYFKPVRMTERITICPSWEDYEPERPDELIIMLDPGMAFGTGSHETTALSARLLEKNMKEGASVLDVGCGSGILTISAALLGADSVEAVDLDDEALRITEENLDVNKIKTSVNVHKSNLLESVSGKFHVIAANLMADLVIMLSETVKEHLDDDGVLIVSGILNEKEPAVTKALKEQGFNINEILREGEWCAISAV